MSIKLKHSGGNAVSLHPPTSAPTSSDVQFKLPNADGSADQVMKTNGSGQLSFATLTTGKLLQVVSNSTQTRTTASSNTGTFYTSSLTANITPSATNSKIFVLASGNYYTTNTTTGGLSLFRDSTNLGHSTHGLAYVGGDASSYGAFTLHYLDSPNTTSQITYSFRVSRTYGSDAVYAPVGDNNYSPAQIFLAEIGA